LVSYTEHDSKIGFGLEQKLSSIIEALAKPKIRFLSHDRYNCFFGETMKRYLTLGTATLFMILAGCGTKTGTGALAGGGLGAIAGGAAGGGKGALIGGAVGAVAGGVVGASLDEQDRKVMERTSPRTVDRMDRKEPLTVNDVIKLSQGGVSDESIIRYLQQTGSTYNLSQAQIRRLQDAGVSQRVVNYMVDSGR
jgi:hypothetical protein